MKIRNAQYTLEQLSPDDLFICAWGFETRSYHLFSQASKRLPQENILVFAFEKLISARTKEIAVAEPLESYHSLCIQKVSYEDYESACAMLVDFINKKAKKDSPLKIHIDYSSMPRGWYCRFPVSLSEHLRKEDQVFFWYVDGRYPDSYTNYPSAGIRSFVHFSGKATLRTNSKRLHIISLSYDVIRTQATISLLDPDSFVACAAYDSRNEEIHKNVLSINQTIIPHANMLISLRMDDFEFMIAKLSELANEYVQEGDVIFVPDGPKPLIFAESLIPYVTRKRGISCLHIIRNNRFFNPVEVFPTENIIGFVLSN